MKPAEVMGKLTRKQVSSVVCECAAAGDVFWISQEVEHGLACIL